MKKNFFLIMILIFLMSTGNAVIKGIPIKDDQYAHMFSSAWITEIGKANNLDWWQNLGIVLGFSVIKELYDTESTGFDFGDVGYNLSGYLLSYTFGPPARARQDSPGLNLAVPSPLLATSNIIPSANLSN